MKIAFYAPMKSPDHPTPSGDRRMARLFMQALSNAGYEVELASSFRSFDKNGDAEFQEKVRLSAHQEAQKLIAKYEGAGPDERPALWFSYHLYHKAPDWIGPIVSDALDIPYFVAEASHAPKQDGGPWASGYSAAATAISKADRIFHMTRLDGACLEPLAKSSETLVYLPPFIENLTTERVIERGSRSKVNLLSVAMMRDGDKFQSFCQLAEALEYLEGEDWQLLIAGDGEKRADVEKLFARFGDRITYLGRLEEAELIKTYERSDIYVWPAHGEAFGMAFLEAARAGLPVVAGNLRGVPDVVMDSRTGLLSPVGDMKIFADHVRTLIDDPALRLKMGDEGQRFVREERSLKATSSALKSHVEKVIL